MHSVSLCFASLDYNVHEFPVRPPVAIAERYLLSDITTRPTQPAQTMVTEV